MNSHNSSSCTSCEERFSFTSSWSGRVGRAVNMSALKLRLLFRYLEGWRYATYSRWLTQSWLIDILYRLHGQCRQGRCPVPDRYTFAHHYVSVMKFVFAIFCPDLLEDVRSISSEARIRRTIDLSLNILAASTFAEILCWNISVNLLTWFLDIGTLSIFWEFRLISFLWVKLVPRNQVLFPLPLQTACWTCSYCIIPTIQ